MTTTTKTATYSWADNLSWIRGKHRLRTGGFFLTQYNGRPTPAARAAKSPSRRSRISCWD